MPLERKAKYELLYDLPGMEAGTIVSGGFKRVFHDGGGVVTGVLYFTDDFLKKHKTWFRRVYLCGLCESVDTTPIQLTVVGAGQKVIIYRCLDHFQQPFKYDEEVHESTVNFETDDISSEDDEDELCEFCQKMREQNHDTNIKCNHKHSDNDAAP